MSGILHHSGQDDWPEQPKSISSTRSQEEEHPVREIMLYSAERKPDEWDNLLERKPFSIRELISPDFSSTR